MKPAEARELIAAAVDRGTGTWADLGAGDGTFTLALASLLEPGSRVFAVDRDRRALAELARKARDGKVTVVPLVADFTKPFEWPGLGDELLDGMLFANALRYVKDPASLLHRLVARLKSGGRVIVVEYDHRRANPWVPYPISSADLPTIAKAAGLSVPEEIARRPSAFGGDLYVVRMDRSTGLSVSPS